MFNAKQLLYLAPLAGFAFADLELDRDDVPPPCRDICQPIVDLTNRCQVDLRSDRDRDEDLLERQCVCTNDSFDVGRIAGLCASCFQQNFRVPDTDDDDDDDTEWDDDGKHDFLSKVFMKISTLTSTLLDIREIVRDCGFSSASYSSQLSTAARTINVVATAPTATDQLTTTITQAGGNSNTRPTDDSSGNSNNNNDDNNDNNDDSNNNNSNDDNNNDSSNNSNDNNDDDDGLGVPGAVPLGGFSGKVVLYAFGAVAAGGALLL